MEIKPPPVEAPTAREFHARRCFLVGITDPAKVAKLWAEERARIDAARPRTKQGAKQ